MQEQVLHSLNQFDPITLEEMDGVKLMDRTDTKFTFNINELPGILEEAKIYYKVLNVEGNRISRYKTLYFDTQDFDLYNEHHSGKLNRYKIRHRTYVESNLGFLEVKFKNNKGRTLKTRIKEVEVPELNTGKAFEFLKKMLPFDPLILLPRIWINYSRITLVNKTSAERLTLDLNLEFEKNGKKQILDQLVIAEVKQDSKVASPFISIMRNKHIRQGSISKYCFGIASSYSEVKKNNFKQKLSNVKKIINL
ncbi:MAG TPA: polyphosphate polymerase domain-containing protein [Bacteroidia bacterium]|nr:polyphosphate polymerase domain-containing protein [Bacteroidia bacterium]